MSVQFVFNLKKSKTTQASENGFNLKSEGHSTLLLVHGLTGTPNEMKFLGNYFYRRGYTAVCPRLENHGEPIEVLKYTKWEAFYKSVRKAFLELKTPGPVFTAGLSMGALLSLLLAAEFHQPLPRLLRECPSSYLLCPLGGLTSIRRTFFRPHFSQRVGCLASIAWNASNV